MRDRINGKLESMAVPMEKYDFSKEIYNKLFPGRKVRTPIGDVKLGEHQFEKLKAKNREEYLGAVFQTLNDPIVVIESEKNSEKVKLYVKSFRDQSDLEIDIVVSVVVDFNGKLISISTHRRGLNNTLNKIKKGNLLYEKEVAQTVDTGAFNSPSSEERQPTNSVSPESGGKSSDFDKKEMGPTEVAQR